MSRPSQWCGLNVIYSHIMQMTFRSSFQMAKRFRKAARYTRTSRYSRPIRRTRRYQPKATARMASV